MSDIDQYREYARECLESAKQAASPEEEKIFIEMAQCWTRTVHLLQRQSGAPHRSPAGAQAP
jgi:hypothetical protein